MARYGSGAHLLAEGGAARDIVTGESDQRSVPRRWSSADGVRARHRTADRLPPLVCGCRDSLSHRHLDDRCRWPHRRETHRAA